VTEVKCKGCNYFKCLETKYKVFSTFRPSSSTILHGLKVLFKCPAGEMYLWKARREQLAF
jgi:hypothetical protein